MNRPIWFVSALAAIVGILFGWSLLSAQGSKSPHAIPEGFTGEYVFIEKQDGGFVLLHKPQIRSLAGKHYLVGQTFSIPDVTDDELFTSSAQWVDLEKVRRMGETNPESVVENARGIFARKKRESASK